MSSTPHDARRVDIRTWVESARPCPRRNKQIVSFDNFTSRQGARTSSALKKQMVLKRQILLSVIELVDLSTRLFDCVTAHTPAAHASRSPAEIAPGREYLAQS